jgi:threonine synthase
MAKPEYLRCVECDHQQKYEPFTPTVCENCESEWLVAHYDYGSLKRALLRGLPERSFNIWRYHEVLPVTPPPGHKYDPVGGTPLRHSKRYGDSLSLSNLFIKDERYGPTSTFKDRQAKIAVTALLAERISEVVIASSGNASVAYAAACAQADIKLWVFMTSTVPAEKLRETALFGAEVIKVSGTFDETRKIAAEFAAQRGLMLDRGVTNLAARDAMKTIAYEIVEQLGWRAPDWYVQAVSAGLGPFGVYRGFEELFELGLIDRIPSLAVIQPEGCAPMVQAFRLGETVAEPVIPNTRISILATGDPGNIYSYLSQYIHAYGGSMESVTDEQAFKAIKTLAKMDGLTMEPATAVAFAGLEKLVSQGVILPESTIVVNCTGHGFPLEKYELEDQNDDNIEFGDIPSANLTDGLQAALNTLDEKTTSVLVVDDNLDAVRLIRRLLELKKKYRVYDANNGRVGIELARRHLPDLIILDLMMPEIDGFGVIEKLKDDPRTQHIPVIVVSAKDISGDEWQLLRGQIEGIYQKGSLPPRDFVNQVVEVIEQKTMAKGEA